MPGGTQGVRGGESKPQAQRGQSPAPRLFPTTRRSRQRQPSTHPCPAPPGTHLGHKLLVLLVQVCRGGHVVPPDPQLALLGEPGGGGRGGTRDARAGGPQQGRARRSGSTGHKAAAFLFLFQRALASGKGCSKPEPARASAQRHQGRPVCVDGEGAQHPAHPLAAPQPRAHLSAARSLSAPRV